MVLILLFAIIGIAPAIAQLKIKCDTNGWNDLAQLRSNQANAMLKCDADSTTLEDLLELNTPNLEQCFCKPAILEGLVKISTIEDRCALAGATKHAKQTINAWKDACNSTTVIDDATPTTSAPDATPGPSIDSSSSSDQATTDSTTLSSAKTSSAESSSALTALGYGALAPGFVIAVLVFATTSAALII